MILMLNILTYSNGLTRVVSHGILLDTDARPDLPFAFDALYYEPPTELSMKMLAGAQVALSDSEIAACEAYCDAFLDTADYQVFAYDAAGVFAGAMLKSEAQAGGLDYRLAEAPDHPASKWADARWQRIEAAILDDGTLRIRPEAVCDRCALVFTAAEWAAFPQPPAVAYDEEFRWDFGAEAWRDVADPLVFAFDEVGAFVGQHARSYVLSRGWGFSREAPKAFPYKMTDDGWQRLTAVIHEDGACELQPAGIRDDAMLLFTREEWARWPSRPKSVQGEEWVWDFRAEAWRDISNPYGAAFEPDGDRVGVFAGHMTRQDAEKIGLGWTRQLPGAPAAKFINGAWQPVVAVFMDDGTVRLHPEMVCDRCMLALTEAEWAAWPKPPRQIPEGLGDWSWQFAQEQWEDRRELAHVRLAAKKAVEQTLLWASVRQINAVWPEYRELSLAAAEAAQPDGPTPFLAAFAAASGRDMAEVRADFAERHSRAAAIMGEAAARRTGVLSDIEAAQDNEAVERLVTAVRAAYPPVAGAA